MDRRIAGSPNVCGLVDQKMGGSLDRWISRWKDGCIAGSEGRRIDGSVDQ